MALAASFAAGTLTDAPVVVSVGRDWGTDGFRFSAYTRADDTAAAKMAIMRECGIHVVDSPAEIGDTMLRVLGGK